MKDDVYFALDFPNWVKSGEFIEKHDLQGIPVKVGMELFYREGPHLIDKLKQNGHRIFLDLKLHDIPATVRKAIANIAALNVDMVTIHASGGSEMIRQAKEGLLSGSAPGHHPKLLAVTVLTSVSASVLYDELKVAGDGTDYTGHLARLAQQNGADGVVSSVSDVPEIKQACSSSLLAVTPGIRLQGDSAHDQERVATPSQASKNGADILVAGRTVRNAADPSAAYKHVLKEWHNGDA